MSEEIMSSGKRHGEEPLDWKKIGRRIRELRGLYTNQEEFAKQIGVSQGHLSHIERGEKEIGAQILLNIARVCRRSIEWLLTGEDSIQC